jgi:exopolyphosphatase/guanosine-5'-triphosphate,3'-diphosphate pyrophosphatase
MSQTASTSAKRSHPARLGQPMRIAAIDVGSNSIHMVVAEADSDGELTILWRLKESVGLGRASFPSRALSREAMALAVATLVRFNESALQRQCEKVVAVATSAVREASNGGELIERIRRATGMDVRVISGKEEARLIYLGVRRSCSLRGDPHLIVDVGGGSVELIVGNHRRAVMLESRKLGAARMTAAFVKSDPITAEERLALETHFERELGPLCAGILRLNPRRAIGTSGTLETLALMSSDESVKAVENGDDRARMLDRRPFEEVLRRLVKSNAKERAAMRGLDEPRREQIVAGALLVDFLFKRLKLRRMQICKSALREGILVDYLGRHLPDLTIREQVPQPRMRRVLALARRCAWHRTHSEQVARLCVRLFDDLREVHGLGVHERELIEYAALLHDIGWNIAREGHHKHSMYLIRHGELKEFTPEEIEIIANIARYHRKSTPKLKHAGYAQLSPRGKRIVNAGAALLRIADGLDRSHANVIRDLRCRTSANANGNTDVRCILNTRSDAQLEVWGATRKSKMFKKVFGRGIAFEFAKN